MLGIICVEAACWTILLCSLWGIASVHEALPHVDIGAIHWREGNNVFVRTPSIAYVYYIIDFSITAHSRICRVLSYWRWHSVKFFQEVREAMIAEFAANSMLIVTSTWVASTASTHGLVSNRRGHAILVIRIILRRFSIITIILLNILNIMGWYCTALILRQVIMVNRIIISIIVYSSFNLFIRQVIIPLSLISFCDILSFRMLNLLKVQLTAHLITKFIDFIFELLLIQEGLRTVTIFFKVEMRRLKRKGLRMHWITIGLLVLRFLLLLLLNVLKYFHDVTWVIW